MLHHFFFARFRSSRFLSLCCVNLLNNIGVMLEYFDDFIRSLKPLIEFTYSSQAWHFLSFPHPVSLSEVFIDTCIGGSFLRLPKQVISKLLMYFL